MKLFEIRLNRAAIDYVDAPTLEAAEAIYRAAYPENADDVDIIEVDHVDIGNVRVLPCSAGAEK